MGKKSRVKGASAEREVAAILDEVFPEARRNLEQVRDGGSGRDLDMTEPFVVQIKRAKKITKSVIERGLEEATREVDNKYWLYPCVVHRSDREKWMVTMRCSDIADLLDSAPKFGPGLSDLSEVLVTMSIDGFMKFVLETCYY